MATVKRLDQYAPVVDKTKLGSALADLHSLLGIVDLLPITAHQIREQMLRDGVKAEDNIASREIIASRNDGSVL